LRAFLAIGFLAGDASALRLPFLDWVSSLEVVASEEPEAVEPEGSEEPESLDFSGSGFSAGFAFSEIPKVGTFCYNCLRSLPKGLP